MGCIVSYLIQNRAGSNCTSVDSRLMTQRFYFHNNERIQKMENGMKRKTENKMPHKQKQSHQITRQQQLGFLREFKKTDEPKLRTCREMRRDWTQTFRSEVLWFSTGCSCRVTPQCLPDLVPYELALYLFSENVQKTKA